MRHRRHGAKGCLPPCPHPSAAQLPRCQGCACHGNPFLGYSQKSRQPHKPSSAPRTPPGWPLFKILLGTFLKTSGVDEEQRHPAASHPGHPAHHRSNCVVGTHIYTVGATACRDRWNQSRLSPLPPLPGRARGPRRLQFPANAGSGVRSHMQAGARLHVCGFPGNQALSVYLVSPNL